MTSPSTRKETCSKPHIPPEIHEPRHLVSIPYIGRENFEKSAGEALKSAGVVLLITGAGGSFSSVIAATGIGDSVVSLLSTGASAPWFRPCS